MSLQEAEKLLGPATGKSAGRIEWYFNPINRHVAPCLNAQVVEAKLSRWEIGSR